MENVFIYALTEPNNPNEIRYIGKSKNIKRRYTYHISDARKNKNLSHKNNWVRKLLELGYRPEIIEIDCVPNNEWKFWEIYYISLFKTWGFNLTNISLGGNGDINYNRKENTINTLIRKGIDFHRKTPITDEEFKKYLLNREDRIKRKEINKLNTDRLKIVTINAKTGELVKEYANTHEAARDLNTSVSKIQEVINHKTYGKSRARFTYKGLKIIKKVELTEESFKPIEYKKKGNFNRFIEKF